MQSFSQNSDSGGAKSKKSGFYRQKNYDINKFWMPGQTVTDKDLQLLVPVKKFFDQHGYTPTKEDIDNVGELKARFRTWNNVLLAAGLPDKNDPDNQRKRMAATEWKKHMDD